MINWTPDGIRFLRDAAIYTGFYDELARRAASYSEAGDSVCDAGCGIGFLAMALSRLGRNVTAADISSEAMEALKENSGDLLGSGLQTWNGDVFAMPPETRFDSMVFCFFGSVIQTLQTAKRHCRGTVVMFKKNWRMRRFTTSPEPNHRVRFTEASDRLAALGVPFESSSFDLEMGQPFRSFEDALLFFGLYGKDPDPGLVRSRLTATDSPQFPLFLPERKSVGLIAIDSGKIPDSIFEENEDE